MPVDKLSAATRMRNLKMASRRYFGLSSVSGSVYNEKSALRIEREEDVLTSVGVVGRKVDPFLVVVVEGVVQI